MLIFLSECSIKDVTCRYASGWLTTTPKLRVDPDWLTETMNLHRTKNLVSIFHIARSIFSSIHTCRTDDQIC